MKRYLVSWCEPGTLNFGCEFYTTPGLMNEGALVALQKNLRKRKGKSRLTILAFSKLEGQEELPTIDVKKV